MNIAQLGNNIYAVRRSLGLTQENVAFELEISVTSYAKIERGVTNVRFSRLVQIAEVLNVDVSDLVREKEYNGFDCMAQYIAEIKKDIEIIKDAVLLENAEKIY